MIHWQSFNCRIFCILADYLPSFLFSRLMISRKVHNVRVGLIAPLFLSDVDGICWNIG